MSSLPWQILFAVAHVSRAFLLSLAGEPSTPLARATLALHVVAALGRRTVVLAVGARALEHLVAHPDAPLEGALGVRLAARHALVRVVVHLLDEEVGCHGAHGLLPHRVQRRPDHLSLDAVPLQLGQALEFLLPVSALCLSYMFVQKSTNLWLDHARHVVELAVSQVVEDPAGQRHAIALGLRQVLPDAVENLALPSPGTARDPDGVSIRPYSRVWMRTYDADDGISMAMGAKRRGERWPRGCICMQFVGVWLRCVRGKKRGRKKTTEIRRALSTSL